MEKITCIISRSLNDEIEYVLKNLQEQERKKSSGINKKRWTKLEASDELGKILKHKRRENRKFRDIFEF